jgi:ABC-2 type transport system permease protein
METIYILWLRQLKRYFRTKSRIIGALGQPVLFLLALGYGLGPVFKRAGNMNYLEFLVPGIIAQSILFTSIFSGIEVIWDRQFGFLKETLVAPVPRFQIMLGRTLGGATVACFQGLLVLALSFILGARNIDISGIPFAILLMLLIAILFTSLGTAIASLIQDMQGFQLIVNFIIMPLFFLSGALFPLQGIPGPLLIIADVNPLSYGVDGLRGTLTNAVHYGLPLDLLVLVVVTLALVGIGSYLFSKIQA